MKPYVYKKKTRPKHNGVTYDSQTELDLHLNQLKDCSYHTDKVTYSVEHTYEPDFIKVEDGYKILIEVKGYFRTAQEASKYKHIGSSLKDNEVLVFIFDNKDKPLHFRQKRKDGTKPTHAEWARKNGFMCYSLKDIPDKLLG